MSVNITWPVSTWSRARVRNARLLHKRLCNSSWAESATNAHVSLFLRSFSLWIFLDLQNNTIPLKKKKVQSRSRYPYFSIFLKREESTFKRDHLSFNIALKMLDDFFFLSSFIVDKTKGRFLFFFISKKKTIEAIFSGYSRENITLRHCTTSCRYTRNGTSRNESSFL